MSAFKHIRKLVVGFSLGLLVTLGTVGLGYQIWRAPYTLTWAPEVSHEPYYWTVSQLHLAFQDLRTEVLLVDAGVPVNHELIARRSDALQSRIALLIRPSELRDSFRHLKDFDAHAAVFAAFSDEVLPRINNEHFSSVEARSLLPRFNTFEQTILELSSVSWTRDNAAREADLVAIGRRNFLVLAGACLLLLALTVVSILLFRYRNTVAAREAAVAAEQRAVKAKTQFLGMVSHELRTPLQNIVSALDVLNEKRTRDERSEVTKRIRRSANELTVQLRDMLTLARGKSGRIELRPEVFEACELVREYAEAVQPEAEEKGILLDVQVSDEPLFVVADGVRIGQLLKNLLENAVRYSDRGTIAVSLESVPGKVHHLRLSVADTGPGLPEAAIRIATQTIDSIPDQLGQRRGIGLAVVRTVLQQLGGEMQLKTGAQGTTFVLSIPVVVAEDHPPSANSDEARILVIDDSTELLEGFAQVCAGLRCRCDTASNAATAWNLLAAHAYQLILIDLEMPGKSGTEVAAEIKALGLNGKARLIAMTAGELPNNLDVFEAALQKPITREQISAAMQG